MKKQGHEEPMYGKDEMNLVEFPITLLAKRQGPGKNTIKFTDTITGAGGLPVKREWTITGSEEYGLPLAGDEDVLMALMVAGKEQGFKSRKIYFSRYKLCQIMGWEDKGWSYKRMEEAFDRFKTMGIKAVNGFYDNEKKAYVTKHFGIIDDYELFERKQKDHPGQQTFSFSYVRLNEVLFESIQAGYIKTIDAKLYYSLGSAIAKRLFRYLDKKKYDGKRKFEIGIFNLAEAHLGLKLCKYPSQIKQQLNPAHEELIQAGFLKSAEYQKTSDGSSEKVVYHFGQQTKLTEGAPARPAKEIRSAAPLPLDAELLARLIEIGVTRKIAEQILLEYPTEAVRAQVEALPHRKAEDAPAALVSSIMNDWSLPASHKKQKQSLARAEAEKKQREQEKQQKAEHRTRIEEYLSALAGEELAELTRQARDLAGQEYGTLFPGKEIPDYQVTGYLHILVEKRLKGAL